MAGVVIIIRIRLTTITLQTPTTDIPTATTAAPMAATPMAAVPTVVAPMAAALMAAAAVEVVAEVVAAVAAAAVLRRLSSTVDRVRKNLAHNRMQLRGSHDKNATIRIYCIFQNCHTSGKNSFFCR